MKTIANNICFIFTNITIPILSLTRKYERSIAEVRSRIQESAIQNPEVDKAATPLSFFFSSVFCFQFILHRSAFIVYSLKSLRALL